MGVRVPPFAPNRSNKYEQVLTLGLAAGSSVLKLFGYLAIDFEVGKQHRLPAISVMKAERPDAPFQNTPRMNTAVIGGATYEMSLLMPSKIVV